jgi:uncharacterized LabA/DUF88 family protein
MYDEQHDANTASVVEHPIASEHLEQTNSMDNRATSEEEHPQADSHAHVHSIELGTYEQTEETKTSEILETSTETPVDKGATEIPVEKEEAQAPTEEVAHPEEQQENTTIAIPVEIPPATEEQKQETATAHIPAIEEPVAVEPLLTESPAETAEVIPVVDESNRPPVEENNELPPVEALPLIEVVAEEVRPFTSFIEEFRLAEEARMQGSQSEAFSLLTGALAIRDNIEQPVTLDTGEAIGAIVETTGTVDAAGDVLPEATLHDEQDETITPTQEPMTQTPPAPTPVERPVSPLLRPATRLRLPRHGLHRQHDETVQPVATQQQAEATSPVQGALAAQSVTPTEAGMEPERPRPARRYRFDRPSNANGSVAPTIQPTPQTQQAPQSSLSAAAPRYEENKEKGGTAPLTSAPRVENGQGNNGATSETQPKQTTNDNQNPPAQPIEQPAAQEPVTTESMSTTPSHISEQDRRRRHGQEHPREKEQPVIQQPAATTNTPTTVADIAALVEPETAPTGEVAPEDLPPLEYAELQKAASSRRRRRHRPTPGGTNATPTPVAPTAGMPTKTPAASVASTAPATPAPEQPATQVLPSVTTASAPRTIGNPAQYTIVSGYTVGQMNQGNEVPGPFMGPEPSPARGSVMTRDGRNIRAEAQRTPVYPVRTGDGAVSGSSVQQLASVLSQAIQTQTDRMVAELRRANQSPTSVSVTMPPFPSTERVGVFVDVANLLYSARTLRIAVDFGKLLDFLRGNRRLVRAHAYCPTSPQAGDEQMFLQAVKGLGYRITTKNYKTFSSGAKKADLDLDLCMDVVRLVDGRAVDCVVLVSGDSDFMPMLDYCSDHGVRVEVAAFDEAMSATLRQSCDLFINLSMLEEIRS